MSERHECEQWSASHGWEPCDFCESWGAAVLSVDSRAPIHTPCQHFDLADSFDYVCYFNHHSGTEMEEGALYAGVVHGLSEEYTLARFYSHPKVVELGYEAE